MGVKSALKSLMLALLIGLPALTVQAQPLSSQCITAPKRTLPCPNLIYTSVTLAQQVKIICLCKSDKHSLLKLFSETDSAQSRVALRKMLSQHNMTRQELLTLTRKIPL